MEENTGSYGRGYALEIHVSDEARTVEIWLTGAHVRPLRWAVSKQTQPNFRISRRDLRILPLLTK